MKVPFARFMAAGLFAGLVLPVTALGKSNAGVMVPPIDFVHRTLSNGLEIYSVEDHTSPTVAVQVWYHVGSKDDPAGRSGFAHLFEHMMFKGNEHLKTDSFQQLTENVGGENNAFTEDDVTVYHEVVPSNYLEPILWAEAERMSSLAVTDPNFSSERDVLKEEYRQRYLNNPYGEFSLAIITNSYSVHPYRRPGIGNLDELDASTLPEVQNFHSAFYRPDNATLVVVGDFHPDQLKDWSEKYFGTIAKPSGEIPRVTAQEPVRAKDKTVVLYSTKAPLSAFAVSYLAPAVRSEDSIALEVADDILSNGASSRLYQSLVYDQQIAQAASLSTNLNEDLGLLTFSVTVASGKSVADAERALDQQLEKILHDGVTQAEVDKAKTRYLTSKLFELETANGKAFALGAAAVILHDPTRVNSDLAKIQAVTPAQIKEVLTRYLSGKKRVVIEYLPEALKATTSPPPEKPSP